MLDVVFECVHFSCGRLVAMCRMYLLFSIVIIITSAFSHETYGKRLRNLATVDTVDSFDMLSY